MNEREKKGKRFFDGNGRNDKMHKRKEKSLSVSFLSSKPGNVVTLVRDTRMDEAELISRWHLTCVLFLVQQTTHRCTKSDTQR